MNRRILSLGALVLIIALMSSLSLFAKPSGDCAIANDGCRAIIDTSIYTGPPPYPVCLIGVPLIQVDVTVTCKDGSGGSTSAVRCGILSDPVSFTVGGKTHIVYPDNGYDWEDTLTNCDALVYKNN